MTFDKFKNNVEQWAAERGIYEHSTPEAQLLKALSELGELADAVIKNDHEGIKDAIGDVAVCMVNYARMEGTRFYLPRNATDVQSDSDEALSKYGIAIISREIAAALVGQRSCNMRRFMKSLLHISGAYGLDFTACCEHAWDQIKNRNGHMVAGGAFVKDDNKVPQKPKEGCSSTRVRVYVCGGEVGWVDQGMAQKLVRINEVNPDYWCSNQTFGDIPSVYILHAGYEPRTPDAHWDIITKKLVE